MTGRLRNMVPLLFTSLLGSCSSEAEQKAVINVPWFSVEVELSTKARAELVESGDTIVLYVGCYYPVKGTRGHPFKGRSPELFTPYTSSTFIHAAHYGLMPGDPALRIADQRVIAKGVEDTSALQAMDYDVLISASSGNKGPSVNVLQCNDIRAPISAIKNKRHGISCSLKTEKS